MAVQNVIGDSFRGATWVSLHNGGGVGWGEVINGGFGMVLDGSEETENKLRMMLHWDVNNGIARRSWARNQGAMFTLEREMKRTPGLKVTVPYIADDKASLRTASIRTTAIAIIPSSRPVKPSFSVVVAFMEMFSGVVLRMAEITSSFPE